VTEASLGLPIGIWKRGLNFTILTCEFQTQTPCCVSFLSDGSVAEYQRAEASFKHFCHVQVKACGIHKASNRLENLFCWHERVLLLLKLMIEILKIDHESDLSILFGNSKPWEAPIAMFNLFWVESPHRTNVALMLQFSFKRRSVLQRCGVWFVPNWSCVEFELLFNWLSNVFASNSLKNSVVFDEYHEQLLPLSISKACDLVHYILKI